MKAKKIVGKLSLNKVTVTHLDAGIMNGLKGGSVFCTQDGVCTLYATCGGTCNNTCGYTCGLLTCETCPTCIGDTCQYPCLPW